MITQPENAQSRLRESNSQHPVYKTYSAPDDTSDASVKSGDLVADSAAESVATAPAVIFCCICRSCTESEEWRPVVGYESEHQVSSLGRIRSLVYPEIRLRKISLSKAGYPVVKFTRDGVPSLKFVHRLVAEAFIPNPLGKPQVNHIDGNKQNDRVENLEWATSQENVQHAYDTGLMNCARKGAKLSAHDVQQIVSLLRSGEKQVDIAARYSISQAMVSKISVGKNWASRDFPSSPRTTGGRRD